MSAREELAAIMLSAGAPMTVRGLLGRVTCLRSDAADALLAMVADGTVTPTVVAGRVDCVALTGSVPIAVQSLPDPVLPPRAHKRKKPSARSVALSKIPAMAAHKPMTVYEIADTLGMRRELAKQYVKHLNKARIIESCGYPPKQRLGYGGREFLYRARQLTP